MSLSQYKYIDDDAVKNLMRNRAATLEGQIAEARLNIRLMKDSGEDVNSEAMKTAIESQERIIRMAEIHLGNTERYMEELEHPLHEVKSEAS